MLVFSAADFEDFLEPRPDMPPAMEGRARGGGAPPGREPLAVPAARHLRRDDLARPRRLRAVNRTCRSTGLHWFFDHAETISPRNIERIKALGGGIAVQHRMAFQGEYFVERYGAQGRRATPPIRRMLERACRSAPAPTPPGSRVYNPVGLALLARHRQDGSAWFSGEEARRAGSRPASSPTSRCCRPTTFSVPRTRSRTSPRC